MEHAHTRADPCLPRRDRPRRRCCCSRAPHRAVAATQNNADDTLSTYSNYGATKVGGEQGRRGATPPPGCATLAACRSACPHVTR